MITINFTEQQLTLVITALTKEPLNAAYETFESIKKQVEEQQQKQEENDNTAD